MNDKTVPTLMILGCLYFMLRGLWAALTGN